MFAYAHSKKVFADVQSEHLEFQLVAFVSDLVPGHYWIEIRSTFFAVSLQMFTYILLAPPCDISRHSFRILSPSSCGKSFSPFIIWFFWMFFSLSMCLLYLGAQNWTHYFRCGLTSANWRVRITSLNMIATLHLIQPRIPSAFSTMVHC